MGERDKGYNMKPYATVATLKDMCGYWLVFTLDGIE